MKLNKKKDFVRGDSDLFDGMFTPSRFHEVFDNMCAFMDRAWRDWDLTGDAFHALQPTKNSFPKINVSETDVAYEVAIAVSGFSKDNMELEFKDSCLFIKLDDSNTVEDVDKLQRRWLTREIASRSFRRTIHFPTEIDGAGIKSTFDEDKALVICTLPKVLKTEPETIKIKIN